MTRASYHASNAVSRTYRLPPRSDLLAFFACMGSSDSWIASHRVKAAQRTPGAVESIGHDSATQACDEASRPFHVHEGGPYRRFIRVEPAAPASECEIGAAVATSPDRNVSAAPSRPTVDALPRGVAGPLVHEICLPRGVGELRENWRRLPPTITVDQLLRSEWLSLTRAPLYRAISRGDLPAVRLGRRTLVLTVPLLRLLGVELDES